MAINFPNTPTVDDTFTVDDVTWIWDGTAWNIVNSGVVIPLNTSNGFQNISVSGQSPVIAETTTDTLTLIAGTNIEITTDPASDAITISSSAAAGAAFSGLSDVSTSSHTIDKVYLPAVSLYEVTNSGTTAYLIDQFTNQNPTIYALAGTTLAFNLNIIGHPFQIQNSIGTNYNTGLIHVSIEGVVSTEANAQAKDSGTLYWKIPGTLTGNYRYQCQFHSGMVGSIVIKNIANI